jgi:diguanylate cyclase (GGDEF)-like protein
MQAGRVLASRLRAEQLRQVLRILPGNVAMTLVLVLTAVSAMWPYVGHRAAITWAAIATVVACARLVIYRSYRKGNEDDLHVLRLAGWQRLACLAAGVAWGLSAAFIWQPQNLLPQLLLLVTLCGVTAGAATSLAADMPSALLFQAPIFSALLVRLLSDGRGVSHVIAFMVTAYSLFTAVTIRRMHHNLTENVVLRLQALERETRLQDSEARYREQAERDALTGLGNRFALQVQLSRLLADAGAAGRRVAVLYIDLDNFKDINDTRGHRCGDQLLQEVARRLRDCVRADDCIYRAGGDEFIVVTQEAGDHRRIELLAQLLRQALAVPVELPEGMMNCSASIGIGVFPDDGEDAELLLKHADVALYQAKGQGRNDYCFYTVGQSQQISDRIELEQSLGEAIRHEHIYLEYQPLINLESGAIAGVEALARWRHAERGVIPPGVFIPAAERCGHIEALGELVLRLLCRQIQLWESSLLPLVPVAINVAPQQLDMGRFTRCFAATTQAFNIDPALFEIEVTESALVNQRQGHLQALEQLQQLGARVSIDDFGTGYSSLSYLKHLPIDSVKVDRCFIRDMISDRRDAAIVSAIVALGHSLGLRVVAEGVESAQQARQLKALGCDAVQGHFYHRPVSGEQFAALLLADASRVRTMGQSSDELPMLQIIGS